MAVTPDYEERVYAGVLGKIIGVYLGRPFEGWSYEHITRELGEVWYYVHERLKAPLVVTDDDISGTFTFLRALEDYGAGRAITAAQIGQTWLNYLIENRTVLWWGGMGNSTEHTAYLRLKHGMPAPRSGSAEMNGRVVAEQIGAQIFIDGWGMVAPGDAPLAADLAAKAARVSHDGEAVYGAQAVAAIEAQAFVERDIQKLIEKALSLIPPDSLISRMIGNIRAWHAAESDWRATREKIAAQYGYDRYGGNCHIVPNHALIIHALLHGEGDFQKSLMIVNTCGWDTDCNSGNVGCILGIRGGLDAIDAGADFRGPVADRIFLPTADGGRCVTDAASEALRIARLGRTLAGAAPAETGCGARYHFAFPGSVQGWLPEDSTEARGVAVVENAGAQGLAIRFHGAAAGRPARASVATFTPLEALKMPGYGLMASPTLYPGQMVRALAAADCANSRPVTCRLYVRAYHTADTLMRVYGPEVALSPGAEQEFEWKIPDTGGQPIAEIGVEATSDLRADGVIYLRWLTWDGVPDTVFRKTQQGDAWRAAWVNGVSEFAGWAEPFRIIQNEGTGLLIQGTREWTDYRVTSKVTPHMVKSCGIAARVQGMRRYYALLLCRGGKARLTRSLDGETTLAEASCNWHLGRSYELALQVTGSRIQGYMDGRQLFDVQDDADPLTGGAIALVCEEGRMAASEVHVSPAC